MNFPQTTAWKETVKNGPNVIIHEDHAHPLVSLQIWVETGSIHELPKAGAGLSHLLEHMVFKGTKNFTGEILASRVEELGASWNAYTSYDRTVYYLHGPADAARELLQLLFELVYVPTLPLKDFEMEREVIRREIAMGNDSPNTAAWTGMMEAAFQLDTRRFPIIGHEERFNAITHEEMVEYHESRYTFDNSFIVISGDLPVEELLKDLEEYAKSVPVRRLSSVTLPEEGVLSMNREELEEFPLPTCKMNLLWQIPPLGHPDHGALDLLSIILGGAYSSILYQNLREKQDVALNVSSWGWSSKQGLGLFSISGECPPEKYDSLKDGIHQELSKIDFTTLEADLKRAKKATKVNQISTLTTVSGRAKDLASNWFYTRNLDHTRLYLKEIEAVTLADIERVARSYLIGKPCVTHSLVPQGFCKKEASTTSGNKTGITPTLETLPNGLPFLIGYDDKLPTINFSLIFKGGKCLETEEQEGISTLHSILLRKGTEQHSAEEFMTAIDDLGASLSFSGGNNTFIMSGFCLVEDLPKLTELALEPLKEPLFSAEQLEKERSLILAKIKENAQDPLSLAFWHTQKTLLPNSPYRFSRLGSEESISKITTADLHAFHNKVITEGEATFTVFGHVGKEEKALLADAFGTLNYQKKTVTLPPPQYRSDTKEITLEKEQAVVVVAYPGISLDSPDSVAMEVIQEHLSSMAGPLFKELREERGLAYYVSCSQFYGINTGMFSFYIGTDPARKDEALEEMLRLIQDIVAKGLSEAELATVKVRLATQNASSDQTHTNQAQAHGMNVLHGKTLEERHLHREKIATITTDEIFTCLKKYFSGTSPAITTVSPSIPTTSE